MSVTLTISVGDISLVLQSYNVIRVERSTTGSGGPFSEITAPTAQAATLLGSQTGNFAVSGLTFELEVDSNPSTLVTFSGANPLTPSQVVDQINSAVGAMIASVEANAVRLTSGSTGTGSKLRVVGGTALAALGFTADQEDIGEDSYISLVPGQFLYEYTDADGEAEYYYRTWFYNTSTQLQSEKSAAFQGSPGVVLDVGLLSLATVDLTNLAGEALAERKVSIYPVSRALVVGGYGVDLGGGGVTITTDNAGHAETYLVRGSRVKVVFEGTSFIRTIEVPDQSTFDLVAAMGLVDDQFDKAVVANLPAAPRRSL